MKRSMSVRAEWRNWPLWLKGLFLYWPSFGSAFLFLTELPSKTGDADIGTILTNIESMNYFMSYFIGFWAMNFVVLGVAWMIISLVSNFVRKDEPEKRTKKKLPKKMKKKKVK